METAMTRGKVKAAVLEIGIPTEAWKMYSSLCGEKK